SPSGRHPRDPGQRVVPDMARGDGSSLPQGGGRVHAPGPFQPAPPRRPREGGDGRGRRESRAGPAVGVRESPPPPATQPLTHRPLRPADAQKTTTPRATSPRRSASKPSLIWS